MKATKSSRGRGSAKGLTVWPAPTPLGCWSWRVTLSRNLYSGYMGWARLGIHASCPCLARGLDTLIVADPQFPIIQGN